MDLALPATAIARPCTVLGAVWVVASGYLLMAGLGVSSPANPVFLSPHRTVGPSH